MDRSPNDALRRRIDEMSNEEYQALIRIRNGAELRTRLTDVADAQYRRDLMVTIKDTPDEELQALVSNLGGALNRAITLGEDALFYDDPGRINTTADRIAKVTAADVQRVAREYLVKTGRTVVITTPKAAPAKGDL